MEELLKKAMDKDEKLLWSGRPEKFETFDKTYSPIFKRKIIISALIGIILTVGFIILSARANMEIKWGAIVIIWLFCVIAPINIYRDANTLTKKIMYGITDRRFITVSDTTKNITYDKLDKAIFYTDADRHTSIICGTKAEKLKEKNLRELATMGVCMDADGKECEKYVMYAVPEAEKLKKLLADYIKIV